MNDRTEMDAFYCFSLTDKGYRDAFGSHLPRPFPSCRCEDVLNDVLKTLSLHALCSVPYFTDCRSVNISFFS